MGGWIARTERPRWGVQLAVPTGRTVVNMASLTYTHGVVPKVAKACSPLRAHVRAAPCPLSAALLSLLSLSLLQPWLEAARMVSPKRGSRGR